MRKKQVLTIGSIALVSFLVGTLFNMNLLAIGKDEGDGSPWDNVWTAISELQSGMDNFNASLTDLQDRVNAIEEGTSQAKTIRFCDPTEYFWNQYEWTTLASFTWAPENTTENAILSVTYFFEYNASVNISTEEVYFNIMIDGWNYPEPFAIQYNKIPVPHGYVWSPVLTLQYLEQTIMGVPYGVKPNAPSHQLEFRICVRNGYMNIWVKNINIIIAVVDGLPAEN